jgi:hypothetical protein
MFYGDSEAPDLRPLLKLWWRFKSTATLRRYRRFERECCFQFSDTSIPKTPLGSEAGGSSCLRNTGCPLQVNTVYRLRRRRNLSHLCAGSGRN